MLDVIMLDVIMLNVDMRSVMAPPIPSCKDWGRLQPCLQTHKFTYGIIYGRDFFILKALTGFVTKLFMAFINSATQ